MVDKKIEFSIVQQKVAMMTFDTPGTPWYMRLFYIIKIPYDILRYVITGRAYFGWGD